jgi:endo-1,4-beta-mannosidase
MTVDEALDAIGPSQQVFRAWFFQPLVSRAGKIDWSIFDHTLAVAASHGEKVIPVLGNQWDTCDSGRYRNEAWYQNGYNVGPDGPHSPLSYQDWVKAVVSRYASNPTIMAWQLLNEPEDATGVKDGPCSPTAARTLQSFAHTMAAIVKLIDPFHLLSLGTAGFGQCGAMGAEYQALYNDPNIDICNYHDYGNPSLPLLQGMTNGLGARVQQAKNLNKPLMVDEMGVDLQKHSNGSLQTRADIFATRIKGMFDAGLVGVLVWDWNWPYRSANDVGPGDPLLQVLRTVR